MVVVIFVWNLVCVRISLVHALDGLFRFLDMWLDVKVNFGYLLLFVVVAGDKIHKMSMRACFIFFSVRGYGDRQIRGPCRPRTWTRSLTGEHWVYFRSRLQRWVSIHPLLLIHQTLLHVLLCGNHSWDLFCSQCLGDYSYWGCFFSPKVIMCPNHQSAHQIRAS